MKVVGIIAEYNPFHNGHKYQLDYAKNVLGADMVVVAMSGSFTQRGEIAITDKYQRAKMALINGADLVFELPAIFSCASAKEFATAGVLLLAKTGVVDTILFGTEADDVEEIVDAAKKLIEAEKNSVFNEKVQLLCARGYSYPTAREMALEGDIDCDLLNNPNNILGIEYTKAILERNIKMDICNLKRQGNDYNETSLSGILSSATSIREGLKNKKSITSAVPENVYKILCEGPIIFNDDISLLLHNKLISENDFSKYLDCSIELSNKINNHKKDFVSMSQFAMLLKSKDLQYSRISRVLCHILLNIKQTDFELEKASGYIRYLRLLGFSKNGSELLSTIKEKNMAPIITAPTSDCVTDTYAADLIRMIQTLKEEKAFPNEYTKKFDLVNL